MNEHMNPPWNAKRVQQRMLDRGWTRADLEEAAALQARLAQDEACRQAIAEYDALRASLLPEQADMNDDDVDGGGLDVNAEPTDGWAAFEARLSDHVRSLDRPTERRRWLGWTLQLAAAVAVAALAGGVGYLVGGGAADDGPSMSSDRPQVVEAAPSRYLPDEVEQQVGVFSEVSEVFDRRAGWVAFANGRSELGLANTQIAEAERLLLLRLSLAQDGQVISQADMVIVPGQRATLELPLADGCLLRYHLHVNHQRPARLGLLAEMEAPDGLGETLAALATNLDMQPGQVVAAGSMATVTGGYELTLGFREVERRVDADTGSAMPW